MEQRAVSGCAGSTGDCSSAIPSSSGCEPGRGGERGRLVKRAASRAELPRGSDRGPTPL